MEVILLSDVDNVGLRGEVVNVARGYARNFLLPRKLAEPATPGRVAEVQKRDEQRARNEARTADQATEIAELLNKTVLSFDVKAGPTGALFGSVTTTDIADELWRTRKIRVDRKKIGTDSIRRIGRYSIPIQVFEDITAEVKTLVVPEGGELPPEEELAAMEAAEAEAAAAAQAEADAHRAEAAAAVEAELEAAEEAEEAEAEEPEAAGEPETEEPPQAEDNDETPPTPDVAAEPRSGPFRGSSRAARSVPFGSSAMCTSLRFPHVCGGWRELPAVCGKFLSGA